MKIRASDSMGGLFLNIFEVIHVCESAMLRDVDFKIGQTTFTLKHNLELDEFRDFVHDIEDKVIQLIRLGEEKIIIKAGEGAQITVEVWSKPSSNDKLYTVSIGLVVEDVDSEEE